MVSLVGPTTASATEGLPGAGNVTVSGSVSNDSYAVGSTTWLPGGYTVLSAPSFGTLTIVHDTANAEGGYTWSFVFDSDDPALDALDQGSSMNITFNIQVFDVSWSGTSNAPSTVGGVQVVDTHQVTITIFGENEVCFTRGTKIETPTGPRLIEDLQEGDLVMTRDNGAKPIRWIGCSQISKARRRGNSSLEPILIKRDAIDCGVPSQDLWVSPQHRMLLSGPVVEEVFDADARLIAAKHLCDGHHILPFGEKFQNLEYWHLMLDQHDVVLANGCPAETLYFGNMSEEIFTPTQMTQISEIFPELVAGDQDMIYPELRAKDGKLILDYWEKDGRRNGRPARLVA